MSFLDDISAEFGESLAEPQDGKVPIVTCTVEGPILPEHISKYVNESGQLTTTEKAAEKDVRTLRARHHSVARLLAQGVPEGIVAEMSNYTREYLTVLKSNPSMVELIEHYRGPNNEAAHLIGEKLRHVGTAALERLDERIERDELDDFALLQAAKLGLDRSGHGPSSQVTNVNETRIIVPEELLRLSREARRRDADMIVPVSRVREVLPAPKEDNDGQSD